jgi:hypothetical protein
VWTLPPAPEEELNWIKRRLHVLRPAYREPGIVPARFRRGPDVRRCAAMGCDHMAASGMLVLRQAPATFFCCRFRSRTPGPPPFSSMNARFLSGQFSHFPANREIYRENRFIFLLSAALTTKFHRCRRILRRSVLRLEAGNSLDRNREFVAFEEGSCCSKTAKARLLIKRATEVARHLLLVDARS